MIDQAFKIVKTIKPKFNIIINNKIVKVKKKKVMILNHIEISQILQEQV